VGFRGGGGAGGSGYCVGFCFRRLGCVWPGGGAGLFGGGWVLLSEVVGRGVSWGVGSVVGLVCRFS